MKVAASVALLKQLPELTGLSVHLCVGEGIEGGKACLQHLAALSRLLSLDVGWVCSADQEGLGLGMLAPLTALRRQRQLVGWQQSPKEYPSSTERLYNEVSLML